MRLHFTSFDTESGYDKVLVYDGNDATAPLLHTFSGSSRPIDVFSSGNTVFVSFVTDSSTREDGFNIVYSKITPGKSQRLCEYVDVKQQYLTISVPLMQSSLHPCSYTT